MVEEKGMSFREKFDKLSFKTKLPPLGRVAFNMHPTDGPWGGSSIFVLQLAAFLKWRGFEVTFQLKEGVDLIVLIDPRDDLQKKSFGLPEILNHKDRYPDTKIIHRINECDQRKGTKFMDTLLAEANRVADYTVFISAWLRDYHTGRWFDPSRSHRVIYNGADPKIFHPIGNKPYAGKSPFRVVTHHWSDNPMKGFPVYQQVDELIHGGELPDTELWVIGRWPASIHWKSAKTFSATHGLALAEKLRSCHAYLTASLWEPCGMHHVEGAQCGLPLI
ncbi:MAG: glycosyltransferase family 4 protein [Deltaproteobacteria bacterium]|nr:glycosyltransferase family 4 protein [Deltaproteobacteria bacterium]